MEFLQETLSKDFFMEDDLVIEQLQASMTELRRAKLDLPSPGSTGLRWGGWGVSGSAVALANRPSLLFFLTLLAYNNMTGGHIPSYSTNRWAILTVHLSCLPPVCLTTLHSF